MAPIHSVGELPSWSCCTEIGLAGMEISSAQRHWLRSGQSGSESWSRIPHYKNKESLLFAISLEGHNAALAAVMHADQPIVAPAVRLADTVTAYMKWHADNHALARVVQHELRSLSHEHFNAIADIRRTTSRIFTRIIQAGDVSGDFQTIDVEVATLAMTSLGVDVSRWFPSSTYPEPDIIATRYVELALQMVGAND